MKMAGLKPGENEMAGLKPGENEMGEFRASSW